MARAVSSDAFWSNLADLEAPTRHAGRPQRAGETDVAQGADMGKPGMSDAHVYRKGLPARARIRPNNFRIGGKRLAVVKHDRNRNLFFLLRQRLHCIRV